MRFKRRVYLRSRRHGRGSTGSGRYGCWGSSSPCSGWVLIESSAHPSQGARYRRVSASQCRPRTGERRLGQTGRIRAMEMNGARRLGLVGESDDGLPASGNQKGGTRGDSVVAYERSRPPCWDRPAAGTARPRSRSSQSAFSVTGFATWLCRVCQTLSGASSSLRVGIMLTIWAA